ncbi:MAG: lipoyl(octanoyl) transferase LipB [Thermoleophilia bacterium]|nr:lipoyl(octanoyl) transferase LipB [Thermoleophilia bacterium]
MPADRHDRAADRAELWVARLGTVDYDAALALQQRLHAARAAGTIADVLLLLEHPPVYTRGRRAEPAELPLGENWYLERGIALRDVDRGGKTTYHGPGQLVGYPIVDTAIVNRDIVRFVRALEDSIIAALAGERVVARRDPAGRGVWAGDGKIGSIGLHVAHGVTTHGFAVNVDCDLDPFGWIKPCGLDDPATSIAERSGRTGRVRCFSRRVAFELARNLELRQRLISRARLLERLAAVEDLVFAT